VTHTRRAGFVLIAVTYLVAAVVGVLVFWALGDMSVYGRVLLADVAATILVYLVGVAVHNTSVYDPYWSVAPIIVITGLIIRGGRCDAGVALLLIAIWVWGVRLTANWAVTFTGLGAQDWRYDDLAAAHPRAYWLIALVGITLFPTLVVWASLLPAIACVLVGGLGVWTVVGFVVCLVGVGLELVADIQMQRFRRRRTGLLIREGLWRHARHPNYLGEICMWWGVWVMGMAAAPRLWWFGVGALVTTAMFVFVSIPMADKRNRAIRAGWDDYARSTRALLPLPRR